MLILSILSRSNAFFFGLPLLTKHIVLYDTLLDQNTPAEVEAVLAHELGHWKHNHSFMMLIMGQLVTLANLSLIRLTIFNPALVGCHYIQLAHRVLILSLTHALLIFFSALIFFPAVPFIFILHRKTSHYRLTGVYGAAFAARHDYILRHPRRLSEIRVPSG